MRDRITLWLGVVGVLALVAGAGLAVVRLWPGEEPARAATAADTAHPFVSKRGGFSLRVPDGVRVRRDGGTARFTSADRSLVVTVGPGGSGPVPAASRRLVEGLRSSYRQVRVLGHRTHRVDGHRALTTYGRARNGTGVPLRFVVVVVADRPHTTALTAFTASGSDPQRVVPLVDGLTRSLRLR